MNKEHHYSLVIKWTGNTGSGTSDYRSYERSHKISSENKKDIEASSDPAFRGDKTKHNPEELFLSALSSCHMLWYLHLCAEAGVVVMEYTDAAEGVMVETEKGGGHFSAVILHPLVIVKDERMLEKAYSLHHEANKLCFIANSSNFPITHNAKIEVFMH